MLWSRLYNVLLFAAALVAVPFYGSKMLLTGKYRKSIGPKFGRIPGDIVSRLHEAGTPRIWLHAVSVGEVTAAAPIVAALRSRFPGAGLILSTSTETGQEMARNLVKDATAHIYYPIDIPCIVRKVLDRVRPDVFVPVETELWPNFIRICRERGVKVVMANGRISPRSFRGYRATRFFWKKILASLDDAGVISPIDAKRLSAIGMPVSKIHVLGNAKYDGLAARTAPEMEREMARTLGIGPEDRALVAGSTHDGEESALLEVYRDILARRPDFKLILIPRHIERGDAVTDLARRAGFPDVIRMSSIRNGQVRQGERVIVVDVIGELFKVYSLADVVFCGGSLVPRGGQNLLEAAAWGKVVFHGPFMDDFRDERALLEEAGAGMTVRNREELSAGILGLLDHPDLLREKGESGRRAVAANRGAAVRYAELIAGQLK